MKLECGAMEISALVLDLKLFTFILFRVVAFWKSPVSNVLSKADFASSHDELPLQRFPAY